MSDQPVQVIDAESDPPEPQQETALAPREVPAAGALTSQIVADIHEQVGVLNQIRKAVLACVPESQWQDFGGNPYLEGDGAMNVAHLFGLIVEEPGYEWIQIPGGALQCVCHLTVHRNSRPFTDHGDCDEFDPFLAKRRAELSENGASPEQIRELVRSDIKKKAYANAMSRVVSGWTGLRGLSWADLAELGLRREKAGKGVEFKKGARGGKVQPGSCQDLAQAALGSKLALRARVASCGEVRTTRSGHTCRDVQVTDDTATLWITAWNPGDVALSQNCGVFFREVLVKNYQGRRTYNANGLELAEKEGNGNGNDAANATDAEHRERY